MAAESPKVKGLRYIQIPGNQLSFPLLISPYGQPLFPVKTGYNAYFIAPPPQLIKSLKNLQKLTLFLLIPSLISFVGLDQEELKAAYSISTNSRAHKSKPNYNDLAVRGEQDEEK